MAMHIFVYIHIHSVRHSWRWHWAYRVGFVTEQTRSRVKVLESSDSKIQDPKRLLLVVVAVVSNHVSCLVLVPCTSHPCNQVKRVHPHRIYR